MSDFYTDYIRRKEIQEIATEISKKEAGTKAGGGTALVFLLIIWGIIFLIERDEDRVKTLTQRVERL